MTTDLISKDTRYLRFRETPNPGRRTRLVDVLTRDSSQLGAIEWYAEWRQYCFEPDWDTVWSADCLQEVQTVVDQLNQEHRTSRESKGANEP